MAIRTLSNTDLPTPPEGCLHVALARHVTSSSSDPAIQLLHERRAAMVDALISEQPVSVHDWGATKAKHPSEIVEILIEIAPTVLPSVATIMAAWITRPKSNPKDNDGLMALKLKRPDGAELELRHDKPSSDIQKMMQDFMAGSQK